MASLPSVKPSDAPALEPSHPLTPKTETRFSAKKEGDSGEFAARYVDLADHRSAARAGRRNLLWGTALLFASLLVLALAVILGGPRAVLAPLISLLTFTALWILARLKTFRQRNGVFFALAFTALLGAVLAVCERGLARLDDARTASLPNVLPASSDETPPVPEPPLLSEALHLTPPDPAEGSRVKVIQDTQVTIARNTYRVRAGETFALDSAKDGEVTFIAGEFRARLPQGEVQIIGPQRNQPPAQEKKVAVKPVVKGKAPAADPTAIDIERSARAEALRRFPALASADSPENREFIQAVAELKQRRSAMLDDPEWPIRLAETLAQRSNWQEVSEPEDEVVGRGAPPPPSPPSVGPQ